MPTSDSKLVKELNTLKSEIKIANLKIESTNKELETARSVIEKKNKNIIQLQEEIATLIQKTNTFEDANKERPMIKVDDLTRQLCEIVETINNEATQKSIENKPKILVDQFEVEIKAGIDVKDGIHLTQLQGPELSPQSVSTIKFSLRQAPVITIVDDLDTLNK